MIPEHVATPASSLEVRLLEGQTLRDRLNVLKHYVVAGGIVPLSRHPHWLAVLEDGFGHTPFLLEATCDGRTQGILPLALVASPFFGRFLVSLPYLNSGGVIAYDDETALALIGQAVALADQHRVRHLELRHERPIEHLALTHRMSEKVLMRLNLPATSELLWNELSAKVRNQVRKAQKSLLTVTWGKIDLLNEFHEVFSHNMRDLGTPTYGRRFFKFILHHFDDRAELCVIRFEGRAVAAALLVHGWGISEVLSASTIRQYNSTNANMLLYWHLLKQAVARGQTSFDFGRSTRDGPHYRFKKQWGAVPQPAEWQYHVRYGNPIDVRPDNSKYRFAIAFWKRLPLTLSRIVGPVIAKGIP